MQILSKIPAYVWTFIVGFVIALLIDGCGTSEPETIYVDKPIPKIEKIEVRDTVRFGVRELRIDTIRDTLTNEVIRLNTDTILTVDTLKIVEAWLTELVKYDTTLNFKNGDINLTWQNYQNLSENLQVTLIPKSSTGKLGIMLLAKVGTRSNFKDEYYGNIGAGLLFEKKRFIFGAEYGYSGQHTVNGVVGYKLK